MLQLLIDLYKLFRAFHIFVFHIEILLWKISFFRKVGRAIVFDHNIWLNFGWTKDVSVSCLRTYFAENEGLFSLRHLWRKKLNSVRSWGRHVHRSCTRIAFGEPRSQREVLASLHKPRSTKAHVNASFMKKGSIALLTSLRRLLWHAAFRLNFESGPSCFNLSLESSFAYELELNHTVVFVFDFLTRFNVHVYLNLSLNWFYFYFDKMFSSSFIIVNLLKVWICLP